MTKTVRPWGHYKVLETDEIFQLKKLVVEPGMRLSLQSHSYRSEHWFILSGTALVEIDTQSYLLETGDSIDVKAGSKHRIACSSLVPLVFIEVQTGTSFEEEYIIRYSDDFGRETKD